MVIEAYDIPFARSYWVSPGLFLAGYYPGSIDPYEKSTNLHALIHAGIRVAIDLTEENENTIAGQSIMDYETEWRSLTGDEDSYYRIPIDDMDTPSPEEMKGILDLIDLKIRENKPVYIHCMGGIGRTGTVVGCWLVRHDIVKAIEVFDYIRELRRHDPYRILESPQTEVQRKMVLTWQVGS